MAEEGGKKWTLERITRGFQWSSVVITLLGLLWMGNTAWFIAEAEQTLATVVGWEVVKSRGREFNGFSSTRSVWHAVVEFEDGFGRSQRATSPRGLNRRTWEEGERVPVYYGVEEPSEIFIQDTWEIWFPPMVITALGVFGLLLTTVILYVRQGIAERRAEEVEEIVAKHIAKKKPETTSCR